MTKVKVLSASDESELGPLKLQVTEFLDAVVHRREAPFYAHLDPKFYGIAILPGNNVIDSYEAYIAFHKKWIHNTTGIWNYQFEHFILHSNRLATVVILARYEDTFDGEISIREIRIKDLFVKEGSTWFLVESQNTTISDRGIH